MPKPNDEQRSILCWEDHIEPILDHPDIHIRDKALIAVAWDVFPRPTELHRLSFGDVEDNGEHMTILITGRGGRNRRLPLHKSTPYLREWLEVEHPVNAFLTTDAESLEDADPDTPVWTYTVTNERLSSDSLRMTTKQASNRANVTTDVTLHNIRRSRVFSLISDSGLRVTTLRELIGHLRVRENS
jgi:integrase